jgi:hypothetical protein
MIVVRADYDDEAGVWVATSQDIDGLAVESAVFEDLREKVQAAIADLLELNGWPESDLPDVPICIMAEQLGRVAVP